MPESKAKKNLSVGVEYFTDCVGIAKDHAKPSQNIQQRAVNWYLGCDVVPLTHSDRRA